MRRSIILPATLITLLLAVSSTAQAQFVPDQDVLNYYNRPTISPYIDLLRGRNDGRDVFRYHRNVVRDQNIRRGYLDFLQNQRDLRDNIGQVEQRQQQIQERQTDITDYLRDQSEARRPRRFTNDLNPFYRPRSNPRTGASLTIRPTGHPVYFGGGR